MAVSTRVLLRQVVFNHGQCVPPARIGPMTHWLPLLPSTETINALDRCTVVLPRGGDGWYAPPTNTGGTNDGFPWGEATADGVAQMRSAGRRLVLGERRPPGAARVDVQGAPSRPARRTLEEVTVRSLNYSCCIKSAGALISGAQEAFDDSPAEPEGPRAMHHPVEVLLQQSEDLTVQLAPEMAEYPALAGDAEAQCAELEKPMMHQMLQIAQSLPDPFGDDLTEIAHRSFDEACQILSCLEAARVVDANGPMSEKISALKRFRFMRWAAPLHAGGPETAALVVGPLLSELFRAFDEALEAPAEADVVAPMSLYFSDGPALAALLTSFGLGGAERTSPRWEKLAWPDFASSFELVLIEADGGDPFLQIIHDGEVFVPGLGRDLLSYDLIRERFAASCL